MVVAAETFHDRLPALHSVISAGINANRNALACSCGVERQQRGTHETKRSRLQSRRKKETDVSFEKKSHRLKPPECSEDGGLDRWFLQEPEGDVPNTSSFLTQLTPDVQRDAQQPCAWLNAPGSF